MTYDDVEAATRRRWARTIRENRERLDGSPSQTEFALLFNPPVSQSTVARWETGLAEPRIRHRLEMATIFGISASVLFPYVDVKGAA